MDDPLDPEWKVVRYKDPRSRRVEGGLAEATLSAPGREEATDVRRQARDADPGSEVRGDPILEADVVHVMAHEEDDDEAAYDDDDHFDSDSDDDVPTSPDRAPENEVVRDVLDESE